MCLQAAKTAPRDNEVWGDLRSIEASTCCGLLNGLVNSLPKHYRVMSPVSLLNRVWGLLIQLRPQADDVFLC